MPHTPSVFDVSFLLPNWGFSSPHGICAAVILRLYTSLLSKVALSLPSYPLSSLLITLDPHSGLLTFISIKSIIFCSFSSAFIYRALETHLFKSLRELFSLGHLGDSSVKCHLRLWSWTRGPGIKPQGSVESLLFPLPLSLSLFCRLMLSCSLSNK